LGHGLCAWCPSSLVSPRGDGDMREPEIYMPAPTGETSTLVSDMIESTWQQIKEANQLPAHLVKLGGKPWVK